MSVSEKQVVAKTRVEKVVEAPKVEKKEEKVTAISPDVLYLLMTAEIAGQRKQYDIALEAYLRAARQVNDGRIAERAAKIALYLKNTPKTNEAVSLWLEQDSENLTARRIAILSALRGGDKVQAVEHLSKLLQSDPAGFEPTLLEVVKSLGKKGDVNFIFDVLTDLSHQYPQQASVYFVQALLAGQIGKHKVATEKIAVAMKLQPDWDKAILLQAQLAAQSGDLVLTQQKLSQILNKDPDNEQVTRMLGQVLMKLKHFDDAVLLYQQFLKKHPDDEESKFALAIVYLQQNKDDQALAYLKQLVNRPRWDAQASFYIGRIEFKKKNDAVALIWFDKVTHGPYVFDASMSAISVLLGQKDFVEAEKRVTILFDKFPEKKISILLLKAEILSEQKKNQQAFDVLTEGLQQFVNNRDLLYTRALIAEKMDLLDVLEDDLKIILQKYPDDVSALNALGYTLVDRTERYQEAEVYLNKAIKLNPEEAVVIDSMGWLYFKQGKFDQALKSLRKAYSKQKESEIAAHLSEVMWLLGDKQGAKDVFTEAFKKSPENEYLLKFKKRFLQSSK